MMNGHVWTVAIDWGGAPEMEALGRYLRSGIGRGTGVGAPLAESAPGAAVDESAQTDGGIEETRTAVRVKRACTASGKTAGAARSEG